MLKLYDKQLYEPTMTISEIRGSKAGHSDLVLPFPVWSSD
jgi:hypothetical protein